MLLSGDTAPSERRSAQVIYPAAFHPNRIETPQEWAAEAVRQHLQARAAAVAGWRGSATAAVACDFQQDARTGQLVASGFVAGQAFQASSIVAPLPQPPRGWLARFFGGAL